jgi:hypothetical protein
VNSINTNQKFGSLTIKNNHFLYSEIQNPQNALIVLPSFFDFDIKFNKFEIDNAKYCPFSSYPFLIPTVLYKAAYNYFGKHQIELFQNCLLEKNSNFFDYEPLCDENLNVISNYKPRVFIKENLIIEGYLMQNQTLTCNSDLYATSNLVIPKNSSLTIKSGCNLIFAPGLKMLVEGSLRVEGNSSNPVLFSSNQYWNGVENYGDVSVNYLTITNTRSAFLSYESLYLDNFYFQSPFYYEFYYAVSIQNKDPNKKITLSLTSSTILYSFIYVDHVEFLSDNFTFNGNLTTARLCKINIKIQISH